MTFTQEDKAKAFNLLLRKSIQDDDKHTHSIETVLDKDGKEYDCLVTQLNKFSGDVTKRMFFEGVFMDAYSSVFIEKSKVSELKSVMTDIETDHIYFVNFTPRNTYIFDLFKLEMDGKLLFVNGDTAYIDITDATEVDFPYVPKSMESNESPDLKNIVAEGYSDEPDFKRYKVDADGNLFFESTEEFAVAPLYVKKRHLVERYIKMHLLPTEDKAKMIEKYGTIEKLHQFLRERAKINFLSVSSGKNYGPNKYEIS